MDVRSTSSPISVRAPWGRGYGGSMRLLVLTAALGLVACNRTPSSVGSADAAAARAVRQTAVAELAPAQAAGDVLEGPTGVDAEGFPRQHVNRVAVRALLAQKKFDALTAAFTEMQDAFEREPKHESWPMDAGDAFASAEPEIVPLLDAWVAASPRSFAPYFARGTHWLEEAYVRRGSAWAHETPKEDMEKMHEALALATADLRKALSMRPKLVGAHRHLVRVHMAEGDRDGEQVAIQGALSACPSCFRVRVSHMFAMMPRWLGSHAQMREFARRAEESSMDPRMKLLKGYVDLDRAHAFSRDKRYKEALEAIQRACALGDHWEFLEERAALHLRLEDVASARTDIDRADRLRPMDPAVIERRIAVAVHESRWEAAGRDLQLVVRMNPTSYAARGRLANVLDGLVFEGWEHHTAGRRDDALRVYDLAAELAPNDARVQQRRAAVIAGGGDPASAVAELEKAAAGAPDDFRAQQSLDYALARAGRFDRVVVLWTEYLARHPDDGPAYLERGGAYFRLRKLPEAHADANKACSLGVSEGCARAKHVSAMLR